MTIHRQQCACLARGCMSQLTWSAGPDADPSPTLLRAGWSLDCGRWICGQHGGPDMPAEPSGMPGAGCTDPRSTHPHWCGFCGAQLLFSAAQCRQLIATPPCPRCREVAWRSEIDDLTAPDYREPQ